MKNKVLVVAPHPDDETLGCGGTLLKFKKQGAKVFWLLVTAMRSEEGYKQSRISVREKEIQKVAKAYRFDGVFQLGYPAAGLDAVPMSKLVRSLGDIVKKVKPQLIFLPYERDVHTDHQTTCKAMASCFKWFRYPLAKKVLAYETLSETDHAVPRGKAGFTPQVFNDITPYLSEKIRIMKIYKSEVGEFPFPRSPKAIEALAAVRGAACGCKAAEAFMLIKETME